MPTVPALTFRGAGNTTLGGNLTDTGGSQVTKLDGGTLTLSGANNYTGPTTVSGGTLVAASHTALGTAAGGTAVNEGATLALSGGITVSGEALRIDATAASGPDHLVSLGGTNTWTGDITWTSYQTAVGTFTGGDLGEGLDLEGTFPYAVNVGSTAAGPVRGRTFTSTEGAGTPGFAINAPGVAAPWFAPDYGSSADDDALEAITQSIRHANAGPGTIRLELANLTPGRRYKAQVIVDELTGYGVRGFDVWAEGRLIVDEFGTAVTNASAAGGVITYEFLATDDTLNVVLDGAGAAFPDRNPVINAVTLEDLGAAANAAVRVRSDLGSTLNLDGNIILGAGSATLAVQRRRRHGGPRHDRRRVLRTKCLGRVAHGLLAPGRERPCPTVVDSAGTRQRHLS